jgi:hypothetical protein
MHLGWCELRCSNVQLPVLLLPPPAAFATAHFSEQIQAEAAAALQIKHESSVVSLQVTVQDSATQAAVLMKQFGCISAAADHP